MLLFPSTEAASIPGRSAPRGPKRPFPQRRSYSAGRDESTASCAFRVSINLEQLRIQCLPTLLGCAIEARMTGLTPPPRRTSIKRKQRTGGAHGQPGDTPGEIRRLHGP